MSDGARNTTLGERFDRLTLVGMAVGVAILLQPWWSGGFRVGFFVTLVSTLAQIFAAHLPARSSARSSAPGAQPHEERA
ncbi:MAG: hypothetical protein L6Q99_08525 [Planctomycetes bacterium]|nr:hypothetical protein [Planctomycetota bacterium]